MNARSRDAWVLLATIAASSLAFIDGSVVTLALPEIQRQFHASASAVTWIVELYTLVLGALMLLGGALGDRYGRRRIFIAGTILFAIGSVACAFSWTIASMLGARVVQGIGGMLLVPASLAIVGEHFTGTARGRAFAAWSSFGALTSALGPMAGGILIDTLGWRSVFWINVPLAMLVLYASLHAIQESRDDRAPKYLDIFGAALATGGLGALTYALIASTQTGWGDWRILACVAIAVLLLAWFAFHESRAKAALVPPDIFSSRTFSSLNIATLALYGALGGLFYEMPFAMIQAHGYSATQTAFATLPMIGGVAGLARFGSILRAKIGLRTVLTIGPIIVACGFALLALLERNAAYLVGFFPGILLIGLGMGIVVAPLTAGIMDAVSARHVGVASGINNAVSRVAGLLAIASLTAVLAATYNARLDANLQRIHATSVQRDAAIAQRDRLAGARFNDAALQRISNDSFNTGFAAIAGICALLSLAASIVCFIGIKDEELVSAKDAAGATG
ncbi:MAG: MFS transporter, partial [Candidatus Eremiobacteraeota bacterium]|nr:MFS transporter [Candidatus Eremiobacteraeota bacterium]